MMKRPFAVCALCTAVMTLVACNADRDLVAPSQTTLSKHNDVILLSPQMQAIPCLGQLTISWRLVSPVERYRVDIAARFLNEDGQVFMEQEIARNLHCSNSCAWNVPEVECARTVLDFEVRGQHVGGRFTKSFEVGPTRIATSRGDPANRLR